MKDYGSTGVLALCIIGLVMVALLVALSDRGQADLLLTQQGKEKQATTNSTDVSSLAPEPTDSSERELQRVRNDVFSLHIEPISDSNPERVRFVHLRSIEPMPLADSDTVVLGRVSQAQSYLSTDKSQIYTQYRIEIEEVLQNSARLPLTPDQHGFVAVQTGGAIRMPSGIIWRQTDMGTDRLLHAGRRYLLFLLSFPKIKGYSVLRHYEFRDGRIIFSLPDDNGNEVSQPYTNIGEESFLQRVRAAITSYNKSSAEGGK